MAGKDGKDGGGKTGSSSCAVSNSSGTVSTTYTSTGSRLSSISMEAALHFDFEIHNDHNVSREETEEGHIRHIGSLVQEFFAAPSANCSGDMRVLERWFWELGVGWILHLPLAADGASAATVKLEHTLEFGPTELDPCSRGNSPNHPFHSVAVARSRLHVHGPAHYFRGRTSCC
ncbi:unnamed protein product [Urochloa humidicola]